MTIAQQIAAADTPGKKAAATKRLEKAVANAVAQGANETTTRAAYKANVTRLLQKRRG